MSEQDSRSEERVILSERSDHPDQRNSGNPIVVSGMALLVFTLFYMAFVYIMPLGIVLEPISNFLLDPFGLTVGIGDRPFGFRIVTSIYCAGLFFFLSDVCRAAPTLLAQRISKRRLDLIERTYPHIWGNLLIFTVVVPVAVVAVTTIAASLLPSVENLWEVLIAGYSGAIIGAYRQVAAYFLSEY